MQEEFKNTNLLSDQFLGLDYIHSNEWTPSDEAKQWTVECFMLI